MDVYANIFNPPDSFQNMASTKLIAVAVVAIVVVAAVGLVLMSGDEDSEYRSDNDQGRLKIFGNANNDDYLDEKDIEALESIISGEMEKTPFSDANQDGKVNQSDIDFVERMVDREKMTIYYLNNNSEVKSCAYPKSSVAALPNTTLALMKSIGATDMIKGIPGGNLDATMFADLKESATVMSSKATDIDLDTAADEGIDCVVVDYSSVYLKNYEQFEKAQIDVIRINAAGGLDSLDWALTVGSRLGLEEESQAFVKFSDDLLKEMNDKLETVSDADRVTTLSVTMSNSIGGIGSSSFVTSEDAGARNLADWTTTTQKANVGDEWILKEQYSSDFIAHTCNYSFSTTSDEIQEIWDTYKVYFEGTDAYKDGGYFIFNSNVPVVIRIAYQVEMYYPDLFEEGYASGIIQEWIDTFIDNLHEDGFTVGEDGIFLIKSDMVKV